VTKHRLLPGRVIKPLNRQAPFPAGKGGGIGPLPPSTNFAGKWETSGQPAARSTLTPSPGRFAGVLCKDLHRAESEGRCALRWRSNLRIACQRPLQRSLAGRKCTAGLKSTLHSGETFRRCSGKRLRSCLDALLCKAPRRVESWRTAYLETPIGQLSAVSANAQEIYRPSILGTLPATGTSIELKDRLNAMSDEICRLYDESVAIAKS
jgi:hypothetical protein